MYFALILLCVVVKEHRRHGNLELLPGYDLLKYLRPSRRKMVGVTGVEPVTLRLSSACSNQLSYTPKTGAARDLRFQNQILNPSLVELRRFELPTYSLQSYRSTN